MVGYGAPRLTHPTHPGSEADVVLHGRWRPTAGHAASGTWRSDRSWRRREDLIAHRPAMAACFVSSGEACIAGRVELFEVVHHLAASLMPFNLRLKILSARSQMTGLLLYCGGPSLRGVETCG
jgi:hypothetical protein